MNRIKGYILVFFMFAISISLFGNSSAYSSGHIGLLTVSDTQVGELGGTADLYLEVQPGNGRIFIDSFPLSKIDTQITFRFATEVACDLLEKDCSGYDFFYTITANSAIVGGPSAGAAATVLTVALLDNQQLRSDTIMTGTINSGNLIGPVAGVPAKALAAQERGYKRVLIPRWDIVNNTPDANLSIEVIPVSTLEDALYHFTGKDYNVSFPEAIDTGDYDSMMSAVTADLCTKYGSKDGNNMVLPNLRSYGYNITNRTQDNFQLASDAINNRSYYSAASFCFGGNVKIDHYMIKNLTNYELKTMYAQLLTNVSEFKRDLDQRSKTLSTLSELETYMIVAERVSETRDILSEMDMDNISSYELAYATERFNTAVVWSKFYDLPGPKFEMDEDLLRVACSKKLSEAEERLNYLDLYYPDPSIRDDLEKAYGYYTDQEFALCIFTASKVKADSDIVLSAIFVPETDIERLLDEKINAARKSIARQSQAGIFPILGYSYYEYSKSLDGTDTYSALLYSEYSLELSNIDMYFKKRDALSLQNVTSKSAREIYIFVLGACAGLFISVVLIMIFGRKKKPKARKK